MSISQDAALAVYARLVAGEPDASSDLIELLLDPLVQALQSRFPDPRHGDLVMDCVIDSLFKLVTVPQRYLPERGSLWSYLYTDARGDILNALDSVSRRPAPVPIDSVELDVPDRNIDIEDTVISMLEPANLPPQVTIDDVRRAVVATFPAERDRAMLQLIIEGERQTEAFARVLGITHLTPLEQRRIVKQHKDRLNLALKRLGKRLTNV